MGDVYVVVFSTAGKIQSVSIVDAEFAKSTARQLRAGKRKVRCMSCEEFAELQQKEFDEYWKTRKFAQYS